MDASMAFAWHDHHFINGIACLDFANTVVYRPFPERREDRLTSLANLRSWIDAAGLSAGGRVNLDDATDLRETIDRLFRSAAREGCSPATLWADFIAHYDGLARRSGLAVSQDGFTLSGPRPPAMMAIAHSALALGLSPMLARVKICGGCGWLFVDRTRNGKKRWCISSMCGSRDKARRYYARRTARS